MQRIPDILASPAHISQRSSLPSPVSSPSLSALPSPPTSPIASRTAGATIRLKASRRQTGHFASVVGLGSGTGSSSSPSHVSANVKAKRRQSSIAYFTPSSPSPWEKEGHLSRLDTPRVGTGSASGSASATEGGHGAAQTTRTDGDGDGDAVNSTASPRSRESRDLMGGVSNREPLTLVERHADLLHFIAQKERKCLELRDQLAVHEKELAELKRKWERIVNRGFSHSVALDPTSALTISPSTSLGGTALEGLKEGVRIITAGLSDLGVGQDIAQRQQEREPPSRRSLSHAQRDSESSASHSNGTGSGRISTSSVSSLWEGDCTITGEMNWDLPGEATTPVNSPLSRTRSMNANMHKRPPRLRSGEFSTPPSAYVPPASVKHSRSTSMDLEGASTSNIEASNATTDSLGPRLLERSAAPPVGSAKCVSSAPALPPPLVMPGLGSLTMGVHNVSAPVSSWMGNMGKKLGEMQKGERFTKNQKRASVLLADVSQSIASVLSTGNPVATPTSPGSPRSRLMSTSPSPSTAISRAERTPLSSKTNRNEAMGSWLDEDEGAIHTGQIMVPDSRPVSSGVAIGNKAEETKVVTPFDDDEWNW